MANPNHYEQLGRARKVAAICDATPYGRTAVQIAAIADDLEDYTPIERAEYAGCCGVKNAPSDTTWAAVIAQLRARTPAIDLALANETFADVTVTAPRSAARRSRKAPSGLRAVRIARKARVTADDCYCAILVARTGRRYVCASCRRMRGEGSR